MRDFDFVPASDVNSNRFEYVFVKIAELVASLCSPAERLSYLHHIHDVITRCCCHGVGINHQS